MITVSEEEGRQGEVRNELRWILLISTVAAVLVMSAFLYFSTRKADNDDAGRQGAIPATDEVRLVEVGPLSVDSIGH